MQPRFRLFAGPNGSGKSSLFNYLRNEKIIHTEIYVSADRIEADVNTSKQFNFNAYRVKVSEQEFKKYISSSGLFQKLSDKTIIHKLILQKGVLRIPKAFINSYTASFIATYLVEKLFDSKQSFCFETVMSHKSKIEMLKMAEKKGYKTYLYFVFTENPLLNEFRVKLRVKQGGHSVDPKKIRNRFYRSFKLLKLALANASNAYLIDNSTDFNVVAEKHAHSFEWIHPTKSGILKKYADL